MTFKEYVEVSVVPIPTLPKIAVFKLSDIYKLQAEIVVVPIPNLPEIFTLELTSPPSLVDK